MRIILTAVIVTFTFFITCNRANDGNDGHISGAHSELNAQQFDRLLQKLANGWNEGDAGKAAECFTSDAIYIEPPDKQLYQGRDELYEFFGGDSGRAGQMKMIWHHIVFDEKQQIGAGEFTFSYGSQVHGMVIVKIKDHKIHRWREYWYESSLDWERFVEESEF